MGKLRASAISTIMATWLATSGCAVTSSSPYQEDISDADCDTTLVDKLIERDVYSRLLSNGDFSIKKDGGNAQGDASNAKELSFSDQIELYTAKRAERLNKLFDCSPENKELNKLAKGVYDDSNSQDGLMSIVVALSKNHMDDVMELYPLEIFLQVSDSYQEKFVAYLGLENIEDRSLFDEDVLTERLHSAVKENYERLALIAMQVEVASTLYTHEGVESVAKGIMSGNIQELIEGEIKSYIMEIIPEPGQTGQQVML